MKTFGDANAVDSWSSGPPRHGFLMEQEKPDSSVRAIPIDGACSYQIRLELRDSGVTESVIFPDLDGLGRELRQLWDDRK